MSLEPLFTAGPAIQIHVLAAVLALAIGSLQLALPKGTGPHRILGWTWVGAMTVICVTAFWIHELRLWGPWSPIHLLAIVTLLSLPPAVLAARRHDVGRHKRIMVLLFVLALVVTGLFTFLPNRLMYQVVTG